MALFAQSFLGMARAQLGRVTEGIALMRETMAGIVRLGLRATVTAYPGPLAEAQDR